MLYSTYIYSQLSRIKERNIKLTQEFMLLDHISIEDYTPLRDKQVQLLEDALELSQTLNDLYLFPILDYELN